MDDITICKKIADIEDMHYFETMYSDRINFLGITTKPDGSGTPPEMIGEYNPLTDDALCFQLMVKYDCDLISPYRPNNNTHWECQIFTDNCADAVSIYDDSPNKAICLAIIEAHKDQS